MDLFSKIEGSEAEIAAMVRGLHTVALVDGLHDREVGMISDLFRDRLGASTTNDRVEVPGSLARFPSIEPRALARLLPGPVLRERFLTAAYLLAWADGKVSFAERASIDAFAAALGVGADVLARCEAEVKEHLLLNAPPNDQSATVSFV